MSLFICPLCHSPLQVAADTWRCDGSLHAKQTVHPFDVAKQGYVNLLPVQQKKSKAPGDSEDSIKARQRFLNAGYYQPLQALISEQIALLLFINQLSKDKLAKSQLSKDQRTQEDKAYAKSRWLDIGCGEGYYTQTMAQTVGIDELIAVDISKPAVVELAKACKAKNNLWYQSGIESDAVAVQKTVIFPIVASAINLPLPAHSVTGISSIFSPILPEIFANTLADEGYLIIAKPDVGHLASVREALFDDVREHDSDKFLPTLAPYFKVLDTHYVSTSLSLPTSALSDLLTMTPYAYRAKIDKREALLASADDAPFKTQAKFVVYILQKIAIETVIKSVP